METEVRVTFDSSERRRPKSVLRRDGTSDAAISFSGTAGASSSWREKRPILWMIW